MNGSRHTKDIMLHIQCIAMHSLRLHIDGTSSAISDTDVDTF